jgi:hypothetical protein
MIHSFKEKRFDNYDSYTTDAFAVDRRGQRGPAVSGIARP